MGGNGLYVAVLLSRFIKKVVHFCVYFRKLRYFAEMSRYTKMSSMGGKQTKKPQSQCSILKHRYNATIKNYLGILTWYLTARRGELISFDMRFTTVEE